MEHLCEAIAFISRHPGVTELGRTKLFKLLYFADSRQLRETGESITSSEYIKYEFGPVPSQGDEALRRLEREGRITLRIEPRDSYDLHAVRAVGDLQPRVLSNEELATLDVVCSELGPHTATVLSRRSHGEPAWLSAGMYDRLSPELMLYGAEEDPDGL